MKAKKKRTPTMAAWLRWLRLHGACSEGVAFVRQYSSPQKAWEGLGAKGHCNWMVWLFRESLPGVPTGVVAGGHDFTHYGEGEAPVAHHAEADPCEDPTCAASILKRYPKVPRWERAK